MQTARRSTVARPRFDRCIQKRCNRIFNPLCRVEGLNGRTTVRLRIALQSAQKESALVTEQPIQARLGDPDCRSNTADIGCVEAIAPKMQRGRTQRIVWVDRTSTRLNSSH